MRRSGSGWREPVPAEPGHADVVGVHRDDAHAADQEQRGHHDVDPQRAGERGEGGGERQRDEQVPEGQPAPPPGVRQLVPHPLLVPVRQPEPSANRIFAPALGSPGSLVTAGQSLSSQMGAPADRLPHAHRQPGDRAVLVRGQRLLHLHRLQDHDHVARRHALPVRDGDLDDRALHRADHAVTAAARGSPMTCWPGGATPGTPRPGGPIPGPPLPGQQPPPAACRPPRP